MEIETLKTLRDALRDCITLPGAVGYDRPGEYARTRLEAINTVANGAIELLNEAAPALQIEAVRIRWKYDESPDLSCIGEYTDDYDPAHVVAVGEHSGELAGNVPDDELPDKGRTFRYFKPYARGEKPSTDKRRRFWKYAQQDFARMEGANAGNWSMCGVYVEAEVSHPEGQGCKRLETLQSGGLWGIESDSSAEYKAEVVGEQFADLVQHLGAFGIEATVDELRAMAEEVD